jgi:hypothetical protein
MRNQSRRALAGVLTLAAWMPAAVASADENLRVSIRWEQLAEALWNAGPLRLKESWLSSPVKAHFSSPDGSPGLYVSPELSVVARDWSGAQPLVGRLAMTDRLRLSRSSRVIISRLRLAYGPVVPFAQAGFGQWRVDTDLMPVMPRDVEPAGVFGAGIEFCADSTTAMGLETDYTILYREQHEPQMISGPHLWGTYFAARVGF